MPLSGKALVALSHQSHCQSVIAQCKHSHCKDMSSILLSFQGASVAGEALCKTVKKPDEKESVLDMRHKLHINGGCNEPSPKDYAKPLCA